MFTLFLFRTLYQDIPLVPLEEFREKAPEHLVNSSIDEHQLMLNRLQFEFEERKRFDAEKRRLLSVKVQLAKANKARRAQINKAEKQLETYIESSQSLQGLFQEPVEPIKTHKELLLADASAAAVVAAAVAAAAASTTTTMDTLGSESGRGFSSPQVQHGEPVVVSFTQDGESLAEVESGVVAPIRFGTTELMQRNNVAQLLPQPLYVLFRHACAFSTTFGEEVRAEIQGDVQAAQVEARALATAQQTAASRSKRDNTIRSGAVINVITVESPSLQKDMVDDDEPVVKERRGSDSSGDSQYERFPLDVVIKIKKDGRASLKKTRSQRKAGNPPIRAAVIHHANDFAHLPMVRFHSLDDSSRRITYYRSFTIWISNATRDRRRCCRVGSKHPKARPFSHLARAVP